MRRLFFSFLTLFIVLLANAADPTATAYSFSDCDGSAKPYPIPSGRIEVPDSLTPVFINHVGRHGARYPSSSRYATTLKAALQRADSLGTITGAGRRLLGLTDYVIAAAHNRWGALDSLGMAEERGIASRMFLNFPDLFADGIVRAYSSYSPRCVASMYEFTHQLDRLNNKVEIYTSAGRQNSASLRPFDNAPDFTDFLRSKVWETPYNDYAVTRLSSAPLQRVLGDKYPLRADEIADLCMAEYHFLSSLAAMGLDVDIAEFLTLEQYNALWSCYNLQQYLCRTATTISTEPAEIASALLLELIRSTEAAIEGRSNADVILRFGHAETLLPLYSMLRLRGCYYLTNWFDTVAQHFRNFDIVPMAANLQMILFRVKGGGWCVRFDLNERSIPLIPNDQRIYIPWDDARAYMVRCLPLIDRP